MAEGRGSRENTGLAIRNRLAALAAEARAAGFVLGSESIRLAVEVIEAEAARVARLDGK